MATIQWSAELKDEYATLWATCAIRSERTRSVDKLTEKLIANKAKYMAVTRELGNGIPWFFVGAIHSLECSLRFDGHLHNGDPLQNRTVHVPKGRPVSGDPPFTWEISATDAMVYEGLHKKTDWRLSRLLFNMEGYNGWGYRLYHPQVKSPYLWSYSNHYQCGKYACDGVWDGDLVSEQCGGAVLLKRMEQTGLIALEPN
jgi:lysozyme family protein